MAKFQQATALNLALYPSQAHSLHRKHHRRGLRHVSIQLLVTEIEALVRKGYLPPDQRENTEALQIAVCDLLFQALGDSA